MPKLTTAYVYVYIIKCNIHNIFHNIRQKKALYLRSMGVDVGGSSVDVFLSLVK